MHIDRRPSIFNSLLVALLLAVLGGGERASAQCSYADFTGNGIVDGEDLVILLSSWGTNNADADINNDGVVAGEDINLVLASWGTCVPLVPLWAELLKGQPSLSDVPNRTLRAAIIDTGLAWRVKDVQTQIKMVLIPPGTFNMGCSASQQNGCSGIENPVHQVTLTYPFYLGETEVTQAQWKALMETNPSYFQSASAEVSQAQVLQRPVEQVSWDHVQTFLTKASGSSPVVPLMRLPTEAEWEYAYRAGTTTAFHSDPDNQSGTNDENSVPDIAWIVSNSDDQTRPVGGRRVNGFHLHDMSGNVWEWVNDRYGPYSAGAQTNPPGPSVGLERVFRGGAFSELAQYCRASSRDSALTSSLSKFTGFRVARDPFKPTIPSWADQVEALPDPSVVTDPNLLAAIIDTGLAWRVKDVQTQIEMVLIPPGTFQMGCSFPTNMPNGCSLNSCPPEEGGTSGGHQVTITKPFYLGRYEVTQEQFENFGNSGLNPSHFRGDTLPVENLTNWGLLDAWLLGTGMRLPTEAEWEYAYRAGTTTAFHGYTGQPSGTNSLGDLDSIAWISNNANLKTWQGGGRACNGFGLYDMSGNVWEWVNDWYGNYPEGPQTNPQGPRSGTEKTIRGGSWKDCGINCRASSRVGLANQPFYQQQGDVGFRVARDPVDPKTPSWAAPTLESKAQPDPGVVTDPNLRFAIRETGWAWKVTDVQTQIEMMLIPPGTFNMGCSASQSWGCTSDENPVHQVTLTNAFYMGRYEVTQAQWQARMGNNPIWFRGNNNNPVEQVSWEDVQPFLTQTGMRLPTEAEWEYAYRAGTTTAFHGYTGQEGGTNNDSLLGNIAWFSGNRSPGTMPVGGKACNGFGLYDMSGNVWEWVNDLYSDTYYTDCANGATDPQGPSSGSSRVLRGGSWDVNSYDCRASVRYYGIPDGSSVDVGFRVARTP